LSFLPFSSQQAVAAYNDAVEDYGVEARPIRLPSGSVNWPTTSPFGA
jgi:hypothetical protein